MRYQMMVLLTLLCLASAQAVEQPNSHGSAYPTLTMEGLEDFRLGLPVPKVSTFPGLTYKALPAEPWEEGGSTLKLFHRGFYLGRAMLDREGRLVELEIVDWRVTYDQGSFAPASTWGHVQSRLPDARLYYAYELDAVVAESETLPGLQVHFGTEDYRIQKKLVGDFTPLTSSELPAGAKAKRLRLFWVPPQE